MFESHIAFGVNLLALVAAAGLLGFAAKTDVCFKTLMKSVAYGVFVLGVLNILCTSYYTVRYWKDDYFKTPYGKSCLMMNGQDGMGMMQNGMMNGDMMKMMNEMMMKHLGQKDATYDRRFLDMMITHHEGAIMMSKNALQNATKPEIKNKAQEIIVAQEKEIAQFKEWRKQ